jgi:hypothetical protein
MKERPILFSTEMVKAILDGRKTMTRRIKGLKDININPNKWQYVDYSYTHSGHKWIFDNHEALDTVYIDCPYGQAGDKLWVRETFQLDEITCKPLYKANYNDCKLNWRPSIFMPHWASRITIEITNIRVERLQDITETDAKSEGVTPNQHIASDRYWPTYKDKFEELWDSINAKRGYSWESNPWVWVISFRLAGEGK